MSCLIKIIQGPLVGQQFTLTAGMSIGRSSGDLAIKDPKASTVHAHIQTDSSGLLMLVDYQSKNGTRVNGEKIKSVVLRPGVVVQIGSTLIEVLSPPAAKAEALATPPKLGSATAKSVFTTTKPESTSAKTATIPSPFTEEPTVAVAPNVAPSVSATPASLPPIEALPPAAKPWNEILESFVQASVKKISSQMKAVAPLDPAIALNFFRGLQAETSWTLGYGPRRAGATSVDLPIFEPNAPDVCFEIVPDPNGVLFQTKYPQLVLLNDRSVKSQILQSGDVIKIAETEIEVELLK